MSLKDFKMFYYFNMLILLCARLLVCLMCLFYMLQEKILVHCFYGGDTPPFRQASFFSPTRETNVKFSEKNKIAFLNWKIGIGFGLRARVLG